MFSPDEQATTSEHPLIFWVDVPAMSPDVALCPEREATPTLYLDLRTEAPHRDLGGVT